MTRPRRIALFGGTFDPVHAGHIAVATAALQRFRLEQILFVPARRPPHKQAADMASFEHRFAMVGLACAGKPQFVPSLLEADSRRISYSVDTISNYKRKFCGPGDHLYFLLGADSFLHIREWKSHARLLGLCDFIVATRPGFPHDKLYRVVPHELMTERNGPEPLVPTGRSVIRLRHSSIYILDKVDSHVSASDVRRRIEHRKPIHGLVPASVEDYIRKVALYR